MLKHEHVIDTKLDQLIRIVETAPGPVDISPLLSYWALDIMSTVAFSEDPGFLERQYDIDKHACRRPLPL